MPRYNVEHESKWIVFSSIVDDFVSPLMTVDEFIQFRKIEYGEIDTLDCITGKARFNRMTLHESLVTIGLMHGMDRVKEVVKDNDLNVDLEQIEIEVRKEEKLAFG